MTKIEFINTGTVVSVRTSDMIRGRVKDNYAKVICNVACIGNVKRKDYEREYKLWHHMISRCYNKKQLKDKPIYGKYEVHEDWLCFEYFLKSMPKIEGYKNWLSEENYEIDKDTKVPGSRLYSVNTCRFIPRSKNRGAMTKARIQGKCKPVQATCIKTGCVHTYHSQREAGRRLGVSNSSVRNSIRDGRIVKGYIFKTIDYYDIKVFDN